MTQIQSHGRGQDCLLDGIRRLYDEERFVDVIVKVGSRKFQCHTLVLSAVSPYFEAMFTSGMKESTEKSVSLQNVNPEIFKDILMFIYQGNDVVTSNNVGELLQISCMLQVLPLVEKCEDFMIRNMDSDNCLNIWRIAKSHSCNKLQEISELHVLNNFDDIWENPDLLLVDKSDLAFILQNENLKVENEESVCKALLRWVGYEEGSRKPHLAELFRNIRLASLPLEYLLDDLDQHPLITSDKQCLAAVKSAIKYHALPARRQAFSDVQAVFRRHDDCDQVLAVIGRRLNANNSYSVEFIGYSFLEKRWLALPVLPEGIGEDFAVCAYGDDIYITGGTENLHSCVQFSSKFSQWRARAPLNGGRYRHSMVAVKESLFVLGGYNFGTLNSVEEYDIRSECWKQVGTLEQSVDATSASAVGDNIYLFGGWLGFAEETAAIQCFNTRTYDCTKISLLPKPCKFTEAVVVGDSIKILYSSGELITFSAKDGHKITHVIRDFSRKNFGLFAHEGGLCIIGGEKNQFSDGIEFKVCDDAIMLQDNMTKTSEDLKLPVPMEVFGCLKIVVRKRYPLMDFSSVREFETD